MVSAGLRLGIIGQTDGRRILAVREPVVDTAVAASLSRDASAFRGVDTGGCPHTAIREDALINLAAVAVINRLFPQLDLILIESGATTSLRPSPPSLPFRPCT